MSTITFRAIVFIVSLIAFTTGFTIALYKIIAGGAANNMYLFLFLPIFLIGIIVTLAKSRTYTKIVLRYLQEQEQYDIKADKLKCQVKVRWKDIRSFDLVKHNDLDYIAVLTTNEEKLIESTQFLTRTDLKNNQKETGCAVLIPAYSKLFSKEEILQNLRFEMGKRQHTPVTLQKAS